MLSDCFLCQYPPNRSRKTLKMNHAVISEPTSQKFITGFHDTHEASAGGGGHNSGGGCGGSLKGLSFLKKVLFIFLLLVLERIWN